VIGRAEWAVGQVVKTWARAQTERLLAQGADEAEARQTLNAMMASPEFIAEMNAKLEQIREWLRSGGTDAPTLH
jgi:hypothetical protein